MAAEVLKPGKSSEIELVRLLTGNRSYAVRDSRVFLQVTQLKTAVTDFSSRLCSQTSFKSNFQPSHLEWLMINNIRVKYNVIIDDIYFLQIAQNIE